MPAQTCLVAFASHYGGTRRIAFSIAERLRARGIAASTVDVASRPNVDLSRYGLVIIGGGVHEGRHSLRLVSWLQRHAVALSHHPTAFFSVSLEAASSVVGAQQRAQGFVDDVLAQTTLSPVYTATFGGTLEYRKYGLVAKRTMKRHAASLGLSTDTSRNTDYADSAGIDWFAQELTDVARITASSRMSAHEVALAMHDRQAARRFQMRPSLAG